MVRSCLPIEEIPIQRADHPREREEPGWVVCTGRGMSGSEPHATKDLIDTKIKGVVDPCLRFRERKKKSARPGKTVFSLFCPTPIILGLGVNFSVVGYWR